MINTKGYHPRAFSASGSSFDVPPLVPDLSSESDESDAVAGFPPPSSVTFGPHGLPSSSTAKAVTNTLDMAMHSHGYVACDQDAALAFLPYSPSSYAYEVAEDNLHKEKLRRRRDKKHERSADPGRIPGGDAQIAQFAHAFSCLQYRLPLLHPGRRLHRRKRRVTGTHRLRSILHFRITPMMAVLVGSDSYDNELDPSPPSFLFLFVPSHQCTYFYAVVGHRLAHVTHCAFAPPFSSLPYPVFAYPLCYLLPVPLYLAS
jgi:hypothetical protein